MKRKFLMLFPLCLTIALVGCGKEESYPASATIKEEQPKYINIVACGDNLYHMPVIKSGLQEDGSYNYSSIYT